MSLFLVKDGDRPVWLAYEDDAAGQVYVYVPNTGKWHRNDAVAVDYYVEQTLDYEAVDVSRAEELARAGVGRLDGRSRASQLAGYRADPGARTMTEVLGVEQVAYQPPPQRRAEAKAELVESSPPGQWVTWNSYPADKRQRAHIAASDLRAGRVRVLARIVTTPFEVRVADAADGRVLVQVSRVATQTSGGPRGGRGPGASATLDPVSLVEWTRLEGSHVEAVVAMLLNRERPNSVRITPSRGDGGVDILDRNAGPDGSDVVYQVKRYTAKLGAKQRADIAASLMTLMTDPRWADLNATEWHLVTPWNPTPESENWLQELGRTHGVRPVWHGLDFVEQLAAKYPDVIDYYLHGGRAQIEEAYAQLFALAGLDRIEEGLTAPDVSSRVERALGTLSHDPHYRYEHQFGEGEPPTVRAPRPGLVMHWMAHDPNAGRLGRWRAIDVIALCAASVDERPILIKGAVVTPDSDFAQTYEDFLTYGAPFTSPEGTYRGELVAPGGLSGPIKGGTVRVGPPADADLGDDRELHLEVLDPDDTVLAAAEVERVEVSRGQKGGFRMVLQEHEGVFTLEDRYNLKEQQVFRSLRFGDISGKPVSSVHPGIRFVSHLRTPNRLRVSTRHTPAERGIIDPTTSFPWAEDQLQYVTAVSTAVETLSVLQEHTSTVIRVPDLSATPSEQLRAWQFAATLLSGDEVTITYDGQGVRIGLESEVTPPDEGTFRVALPLGVAVGEQTIDFGLYEVLLETPTLVDRQEVDGLVQHVFATPDRTLRMRRH